MFTKSLLRNFPSEYIIFLSLSAFRVSVIEHNHGLAVVMFGSGGDLSSRTVASQVLSALQSLTSVFGMGTGVTSA